MLGFVAGIVPFLVIISVIVTIHELGHYLVARLFNTRIERFSVGFGSILLRVKDKRGTDWCVSALPLGGYVKFAGDENIASMMPSAEELEAARASITEREGANAVAEYFHFKPLWQRFLIILAGPVANFVLAIFVFSLVNLVVGEQYTPARITQIIPGSAAQAADLHVGDLITSIDGRPVRGFEELHDEITLRADTRVPIGLERDGHAMVIQVTLKKGPIQDASGRIVGQGGMLGAWFRNPPVQRPMPVGKAIVEGNAQTWGVLDKTFTYLGRIFTGRENGDKVSGILGMTKATGDITMDVAATRIPLWAKVVNVTLVYSQLMAMISVSIGFLNLLPVPALDGGHLAFYAWQSVTKKQVSAGFQNVAFRIAVVLVLGLMLFAAWNDISRFGLLKLFGGTS